MSHLFERLEETRKVKEQDCRDYLTEFLTDPGEYNANRFQRALDAYRVFFESVETLANGTA